MQMTGNWMRDAADQGFDMVATDNYFTQVVGIRHPDEAPPGLHPWRVFGTDGQMFAVRMTKNSEGEWIP